MASATAFFFGTPDAAEDEGDRLVLVLEKLLLAEAPAAEEGGEDPASLLEGAPPFEEDWDGLVMFPYLCISGT